MRGSLICAAIAISCGGKGGPDDGNTSDGLPDIPSPIPADRTTTWDPGITSDVPLGMPLGADGLPQRTIVCATVDPGGNIQAAIDSCPANQVVQLGAGTFDITATIQLKSNVVLRGAGSGTGGTIVHKTNGGTVIAIGTERDGVCYSGIGRGHALTADAAKESKVVTLGQAASGFGAGDLVWIDQLDVDPVVIGDCRYFKRNDASGYRSLAQVNEVASV